MSLAFGILLGAFWPVASHGADSVAAAQLPAGGPLANNSNPLLDPAPLLDPPLVEDPANPFNLPPVETLSPAPLAPPTAPAPAGQRGRQEYFTDYSVNNALTRTASQNARSTGDRFFDGFGGVPHPLDSPFAPRSNARDYLLRLGPVKLTPIVSAAYVTSFGSSTGSTQSVGNARGATAGATPRVFGGSTSQNDTDGNYGLLSAGVSAQIGEPEIGRFLTFDYGASFFLGSEQPGGSNPGQTLSLLAQCDFVKLKLGLGVSFDSLSGNSREFGRDIQRDLATVSVTSSYEFTPKTSLDLDFSVPLSQYAGGIDSTGLTSTAFVNYAYSPKTSFGFGVTAGYTGVSGADAQTFQQVRGRVSSTASPFIAFSGTFGFEWRDAGGVRSTSPVFGVGITWTPRDGTSLTLTADERVQNSAALEQANFTTTSVALSLTQRIGHLSSLGASIGYEHASYESTVSGQSADRLDRTFFAQASISRTFFRHVSIAGTVSYFHVDSNDLPQESTQISISASYVF